MCYAYIVCMTTWLRWSHISRSLKRAVGKINDLHSLNDPIKTLHESLVGRVIPDVVLSVMGVFKLHNKGMCDAILWPNQQGP